jgi:hypothetical protein
MKRIGELKDCCNKLLDGNILNMWCAQAIKSFFGKLVDSLAVDFDSAVSSVSNALSDGPSNQAPVPSQPTPLAAIPSANSNPAPIYTGKSVPKSTRCTSPVPNPDAPVFIKQPWYGAVSELFLSL